MRKMLEQTKGMAKLRHIDSQDPEYMDRLLTEVGGAKIPKQRKPGERIKLKKEEDELEGEAAKDTSPDHIFVLAAGDVLNAVVQSVRDKSNQFFSRCTHRFARL